MTTEQRAARYLASLRRWSQRLRQFAEDWDGGNLDPRERQAFPLEWDNILDRLTDVGELAERGQLSLMSRAELRSVAEELTELLPVMQRLKLRQPDPEALARARSVEAA